MPIYKGSSFKQFLIDRYAMGFDSKAICEEFFRVMGVPITEEECEKILATSEADIHLREAELMKELLSKNAFTALYEIKAQLDDVRQEARDAGDFKTYAQLTNSALKSVEVLISLTERFKAKQEQTKQIGTQNNILVLQLLEKEGAIAIKNQDRLKALFDQPEDAVFSK